MAAKEDQDPKKKKENKSGQQKKDLNEGLRQTFPASDPPAQSRPGHERDEEK
jgi:hypothetical protein